MQPSTITGPTSVCQGTSNVSYSVTNVPGISYNWSYSGSGFTITSGAGTHAITGNFSASATSGTLTVTPSNACGNGPAQSVSVTVNTSSTAPTNVSASNPTICVGQSTTLSASGGTAGTGSSLVWYSGSCGGTWVGTGSSITVSPNSTTTYFVRREAVGCAPTSCASVTVTVNTNSTAPTNVSASPSTICAGGSTTLSASGGTSGTGSTLVWYSGTCGGTQVGTGPSITVSPTSTTTYFVRREAVGCAPTTCASVTVPVNNVPGPGTVSGPTTLCRGQSYTFSTTNNATSYNWYTTGASEITFTGNGQQSVTVNVGSGTTNSTFICVTPSNSCGAGSNRCQSVNIAAPPPVGPISGPTNVCRGQSGVVFSVPNQPGVTYTWSYSGSGFNIVSGQGTHSITANFSTTATFGTLTVTASNGSCSASSSTVIWTHTPHWKKVQYFCEDAWTCAGANPVVQPPLFLPCNANNLGLEDDYIECLPRGGGPPHYIWCYGVWRCSCDP